MATRSLVAVALGMLMLAGCGRTREPDSQRSTQDTSGAAGPIGAAIASRDEASYRTAVDAFVSVPRNEEQVAILVRFLEQEVREDTRWPGSFPPSAEVLLRLGRAGVRPLVRGYRAPVRAMLDLGALPSAPGNAEESPWARIDADQEQALADVVLSTDDDLVDRVAAVTALGSMGRPIGKPTLARLLALCERATSPEDSDQESVERYVTQAVALAALHGLDTTLEAIKWAPACGKRAGLQALARAGRGQPEALQAAEKLMAELDMGVAVHAAGVYRTLGGDVEKARAVVEAGLARREPEVRAAAAFALLDWPDEDAWITDALQRLAKSPEDSVARDAARQTLAVRGSRRG